MSGLRENQKAEKARRLRAAAARSFKQKGYESTTMRAIAAKAKLGLGTVYTYVRDKRALLEMISSQDLAENESRIFGAIKDETPIRQALLFAFGEIYAHHAKDVALARIIVKELSFGKEKGDAHGERMLSLVGRFSALFERAQGRGELGAHFTPMEASMNVFALHFFFLVAWLSGALGEEPPMLPFERALDLQLTGLRGSM